LGVVLYEMATGRLPFPGRSTAEFFAAILKEDPILPSQLNSEIPQPLDQIMLKLLEKDRAMRYQSAADVRADLQRYSETRR
jgi:serine/threonine protein kinase